MKFRTEIQIAPFDVKIDHQNRILALGSCFAGHMAGRLADARFHVTTNPSGILFNPLSIAAAVRSFADRTLVAQSELEYDGEVWYHHGFHGDFSAPNIEKGLAKMNAGRKTGAEALQTADRLLITWGTAWVYERRGEVVANCHRRPAHEFTQRRISVEEIVTTFSDLLAGPLSGKEVIFTVSPVRHLGDGLEGNAISKATLRLAVEQLAAKHANAYYFPAYEILNDDLRDYRFYADDMVHPTAAAVEYVWEKFCEAVLSDQAQRLLPDILRIVTAAAHRPRNPQSETHRAFCRQMLTRIAAMPQVDFRAESDYFQRGIEINS